MAQCAYLWRDCWVMCVERVLLVSTQAGLITKVIMTALYPGWNHSREHSSRSTQQMNQPEVCLPTGILLQINFWLIFFFFLRDHPPPGLAHSTFCPCIVNVWLLNKYKMLLSILWKQVPVRYPSGVVLTLMCDTGLCFVSEKTCHMLFFEDLHPQAILIPTGRCRDLYQQYYSSKIN